MLPASAGRTPIDDLPRLTESIPSPPFFNYFLRRGGRTGTAGGEKTKYIKLEAHHERATLGARRVREAAVGVLPRVGVADRRSAMAARHLLGNENQFSIASISNAIFFLHF